MEMTTRTENMEKDDTTKSAMSASAMASPSPIAHQLRKEANRHLEAARYEQAWSACESVLAAAPKSWWAEAVSARVLLEWGKASDDLSRLEQALERFDAALTQRAAATAGSATADGEVGDDSELAELKNDRGVALYEMGEMSAAELAFTAVLELRPNHERALCNLGLVHWANGNERVALTHFDRAIASANGSNPHSLNNRGVPSQRC